MVTYIRNVNPSIKLITLIVMTFILAFFHNPVTNLIVFAIAFVVTLITGSSKKRMLILMLPVLFLAAAAFITGYQYSTNTAMPAKLEEILSGDSHLWNGMMFGSRVLVYASLGFFFAFTTDRIKMVKSFEKQLHLPQIMAYGLLAAWGVFPNMMYEYKRTKAAFRARGKVAFALSPALLRPLLVKSVRWSESLAVAMESKGFEGHQKRSEFEPIRVHASDWIFMAVLISGTLLLS